MPSKASTSLQTCWNQKPRMAKITDSFFPALCLRLMLAHATRPEASLHGEFYEKTPHEGVEEDCEDVSEEGRLMRRTLVAHLDYIYTQSHHH